jgi:hypothetical protein
MRLLRATKCFVITSRALIEPLHLPEKPFTVEVREDADTYLFLCVLGELRGESFMLERW